MPLGDSLNADHAAFAEARRKRHKSAGDMLKINHKVGRFSLVLMTWLKQSLFFLSDIIKIFVDSLYKI